MEGATGHGPWQPALRASLVSRHLMIVYHLGSDRAFHERDVALPLMMSVSSFIDANIAAPRAQLTAQSRERLR
jgi:hypothetical protein